MKKKLLLTISILTLSLSLSSCSNFLNYPKEEIQSGKNETQTNEGTDTLNKSKEIDYSQVMSNVQKLQEMINEKFLDVNDADVDLELGIYKGVMESLKDPYSEYYSEEEFKALNEQTAGEFGGIGVEVTLNENGLIEIVSPIKGTPGEKAGLRTGDIITHIEGEAVNGYSLNQAVTLMRGEANTDVNITILRGTGKNQEVKDFKITRAIIEVESVHSQMLDNNIGYVLLIGFQERTARDFKTAVDSLISKGAKSLILDLRNNPGGLLDQTVEIADYLMDEATVISVRYKNDKNNEDIKVKDGKMDIPMITLINGGSASASEVLSGALQDNKRSLIVGELSFGKGIIQQIYPINNNGKKEGVKITVAEFYTPNGKQIHKVGISPDYEVKIPDGVTKIGVENLEDDTQLQKAIELLKE